MDRISLAGHGWFDRDSAEMYGEKTYFDGQNRISTATGSQWDHQVLYRTARGQFVLHEWSQWQGSRDSYRTIDKHEAHAWLVAHGHASEVPSAALAALEL